jgi:hypothetical protein
VQPDAKKARGLLAGLTHTDLDMTFDDAWEVLGEVDEDDLKEFEVELLQDHAHRIVVSTKEITVLDTQEAAKDSKNGMVVHSSRLQTNRSLHFNNRINLVQSCVLLREDGAVDRALPPPITGATGTHLQGLGIAAALQAHNANAGQSLAEKQRIVFLGAGACSLPAYLCQSLPYDVAVTAIELSADVCFAARQCFGVDALELGSDGSRDEAGVSRSFELQQGCAIEWLTEVEPSSVDVLIIDIEGDNQSGCASGTPIDLVAPPSFMLSLPFMHSATDALAAGGVLAINFIGTESYLAEMRANFPTLLKGLGEFDVAACRAPAMAPRSSLVDAEGGGSSSSSGRIHAILFVTATSSPSALGAGCVEEALSHPGGTCLVESTPDWLAGWEMWGAGSTE